MILPTLAAALVTRWSALADLVTIEAQVSRGAPVGGFSGPGNYLMVEYDGTPDSTSDSRFDIAPADMAATSLQETGEIVCSAIAQTGNADISACEAQALAMVGEVIADLAADRTVSGVVHNATVTTGAPSQLQNAAGIAVVVPFTVAYFGTYAASAA
jgi:hypothetical protein